MNYLCISDNACENVSMDFRNVSYFSAIIWSFIYKVNQLEVQSCTTVGLTVCPFSGQFSATKH